MSEIIKFDGPIEFMTGDIEEALYLKRLFDAIEASEKTPYGVCGPGTWVKLRSDLPWQVVTEGCVEPGHFSWYTWHGITLFMSPFEREGMLRITGLEYVQV